MIVYCVGLILTILLSEFRNKYNVNTRRKITIRFWQYKIKIRQFNILDIIPAIPLTVIAALRYQVGADYMGTYVLIFEKVLKGQADQAWGDLLYTYLNKVVTIFTSDYVGIFIITAIIFSLFVFSAIYNQSENITFSLYLLVCTGYYFCFLNGMRQLIAAAILLYSIKYIYDKSIMKYAICILIATLFHMSALIFAPVYFLNKLSVGNFKRIIIVIAVFVLSRPLSNIILQFVSYTKYAYHLTNISAERIGYISTIINLVVFVFCCFWNRDEKNELYLNLQMLALCGQAFIGIVPSANRIVWYFGLSSIILIPNVLKTRKGDAAKIVLIVILALYFIYFIYTVGIKNSNLVLPYKWIFER